MKKILNLGVLIGLVLFFSSLATEVKADPPNPPVVPGNHGQGGNINGAPLDGSLLVLLFLVGSGYGGWVLIKKKKKRSKDQVTM